MDICKKFRKRLVTMAEQNGEVPVVLRVEARKKQKVIANLTLSGKVIAQNEWWVMRNGSWRIECFECGEDGCWCWLGMYGTVVPRLSLTL